MTTNKTLSVHYELHAGDDYIISPLSYSQIEPRTILDQRGHLDDSVYGLPQVIEHKNEATKNPLFKDSELSIHKVTIISEVVK